MTVASENLERRLLILAPVGRDASLMGRMLRHDAIVSVACTDLEAAIEELERGAAAILLAEEALADNDGLLEAYIAKQPPWSDLPVLLLTRPGADSGFVERAIDTFGNVTVLERPVRMVAFLSAVRSAMRARARQYQTRAYMAERELADRRKDEFLATLAHELRNPLAPIRNWVSVLRLSATGQSASHVWDMMDRQVNHMVRLVDDLMELSRITRGTIELRREPVALADVISAAVETIRPLADAAQHELLVQVPGDRVVVDGDPVRLAQVFSNLLNNAVKYTDAGGRIGLVARREFGRAIVSVTDSGIGIEPAALPRVFDMFVQADVTHRQAQTGLGIGLTLVRSIVEMHGGRVTARSAGVGQGSEFVVELPVMRSVAAPATPAPGPGRRAVGLPRVLVVDDNEDAADSLGALLRMLGAEVRVAHDGRTALELYGAFHPAAVFLDLGMPGMDGFEIARRIRSRPESRDAMLVALTGWGQEKDRRRTAAAGFNRHLAKPADVETLRSVLASVSW